MLRLEKEADNRKMMEKSIQQGIEQGIEQGSNERAVEIAKQMKSKNIPLDLIEECTNLTREEIENL